MMDDSGEDEAYDMETEEDNKVCNQTHLTNVTASYEEIDDHEKAEQAPVAVKL